MMVPVAACGAGLRPVENGGVVRGASGLAADGADDGQDHVGPLLVAVAGGNRAAFRQLYDLTAPAIYASLKRLLQHPHLADEALQDAYVSVWQKAHSYDPRLGAGMAWLRTIARHRAIDQLRSQRRQARARDELAAEPEPPQGAADHHGLGWALWRAIDELPTQQRLVLLLIYVRGYTHSEISEQLEVPLGTVKTWVRRALLRLNAIVDPPE
jgi:RNA polymerase sigma-70 factor (ECF subfamily)